MSKTSLRRGALTLSAANMIDFGLQFLLPIVLVRLLPTAAFADYRLAWLAIGAAVALAPFGLPRSLLYFVPRSAPAERSAYVNQTLLLLLCGGAAAGLFLGPWNPLLPESLRQMAGAHWFLPVFLSLWVAGQLIEVLPMAGEDMAGQARMIVGLGVLRVLMIAASALSGSAETVFITLVAYAAIRLGLALRHISRHYGLAPFVVNRLTLREQAIYVAPLGMSTALFLLRGQADQWVAAALFPAAVFAAFSIGAIIMQVASLVRNTVTFAISSRLSTLESNADQAGVLRLNQRANVAAAVGLLPTLTLFAVLAVHIVTVVYTERYLIAADVIRMNALALAGVAVEVTTINIVLKQGKALLGADIALLFLGIAGGLLGATLFGVPGAALGNVLSLAAGNVYGFWRVSTVTGVPLRRLQQWNLLLRILGAALAAGGLAVLLDRANLVSSVLGEALVIGVLYLPAYAATLALAGALPEVLALFGGRSTPAPAPCA